MNSSPITFAFVAASICTLAHGKAAAAPPEKSVDIFQTAKVWDVSLTFTPAEYDKLEPKGGGIMPGFGGGPGGGSPGGGRGMFEPANFLVPAFLREDADKDGKLSRAEFVAGGEKWFTAWDAAKGGILSADQLRAGLNATFMPGGMGRPGGPGGRGGPGGPGGGGPGGMGRGFVGQEGARNGFAGATGADFEYVPAALSFDGADFPKVAVRHKGNSTYMTSRGSLKRSMKVDLNKYAKGQKLANIATLNLHSDVMDGSWMSEAVSYALYREAKVPGPRTSYARVFLTVPGRHEHQYLGLYSIVENIDKNFAEEALGTRQGAIFKPTGNQLFKDLGDDWTRYHQIYDPKTDLSPDQQKRVIEFAKLVTHADDTAFASQLGGFLDLDQFARYMAVTVWLSTMDSILAMGQNYYVYLDPKTDKFQFLPWDLDLSFGRGPGGSGDGTTLGIEKPWTNNNRFLERVFKVEAFAKLYRERMQEFSDSIFKAERFDEKIAAIQAAIRPAVEQESKEKLANFDRLAAGQRATPSPGGGGGLPMIGPGLPIKEFVKKRAQSVTDQLAGRPPAPAVENGQGGFGGFGGFGGPGGPGGPGGFGLGMFLADPMMGALDADRDGAITRAEFAGGFARWFETWNVDHTGFLIEEQLRAGLNREFALPGGGGMPGGMR